MESVIQKMLAVEDQARRLVGEAEAEAQRTVAAAQEEAQREKQQALEASRAAARRLVEETTKAALEEKGKRLTERRAALQAAIRTSESDLRREADKVLRRVLGLQ